MYAEREKIEGELGDSTNVDLLTMWWGDGEKVKRFLGQWPMVGPEKYDAPLPLPKEISHRY